MLDFLAVAWLVLSIAVLLHTRANRYLVLSTLGAIVVACYCAASVWMNGALSVAVDEGSASQHVRAALLFEVLAGVAVSASLACLVLAWRRRPRADAAGSPASVVQVKS